MGNCFSKQELEHEEHLNLNVIIRKEAGPIKEAWQGSFEDQLSLTSVSPDEQDSQRNEAISPKCISNKIFRQGNSEVANSPRNKSSQGSDQNAVSTRNASSNKVCKGSQDRLSLQSTTTDTDLNSTTLDLSFSDKGSVGKSIRSLPSVCSVHIDPDESRNCSSISTFKNSQIGEQLIHSSSQSLPNVSSSGFLDIDTFTRKVNDQLRKMSTSKTSRHSRMERALSVIYRLDAAVVNAMNKVQNFRVRSSSRVAPVPVNESRVQTPVSDGLSDVIVLSDME